MIINKTEHLSESLVTLLNSKKNQYTGFLLFYLFTT
jgi:hypothetical protein